MLEKTIQRFAEPSAASRKAASELGAIWCGLMHNSPMWPIHGQYQCRTCGRSYPVQWFGEGFLPPQGKPIIAETSQIRQASFRSVLLPLIVLLAIFAPAYAQAASAAIVDSNDRAAMAFARYIANQVQTAPWSVEAVEIDASLPKSEKQARLRAIRRLPPLGKPEYQVLEIAGDRTVTRQVIARYLSAQIQAAAIPVSSVAITPANYKFTYKGPVETAGAIAYSFAIRPRNKREGLIKGELWLDGETGAVVRQSGYLVKSPSIFVKRVAVTQDTAISDGLAAERVTHLSVDTRVVGRAELTIHERPCTDPGVNSAPGIEEW